MLTEQESPDELAEQVANQPAEVPVVDRTRPPPEQVEASHEARRQLRAGRALARQGNWEGAVDEFRRSVETLETPSARCELGWALFKSDERPGGLNEEARTQLEMAVDELTASAGHRDEHRNTLAACHYNMGRVLEATRRRGAVESYRISNRLRPNPSVARRLESLEGAEGLACTPAACEGPLAGEFEAVLSEAVGGFDVSVLHPSQTFGEMEVVAAQTGEDDELIYAGVRMQDAWYLCRISEMYEGLDAGVPESAQWIAGGPPEFTIDVDETYNGREFGISNTMTEGSRHFVGIENGRPVVYGSVHIRSSSEDGEWTDCDCDDDEFEGWDCCAGVSPIEESSSWSVTPEGTDQIRVQNDATLETEVISIRRLSCI